MGVDVTFKYANKYEQNTDAHHQKLETKPTVLLVEIESGLFALNTMGGFRERYPQVEVNFLELSEFDYNSLENDAIVDRMKELAKKFLLAYEDSGLFEPLTEVPFNQVYHQYDEHLAGVALTINVRELNSQSTC